ncbi:16S rRNA (cytidine(1402)-2'-O)-methyltransferase [Brachyspira intermedia]|uniref:16S rRNA (cytidine(1402)-2'-O)-methyltransferase n=1 Tax=Brachyspira intermedia TaxID=84377 RepID=UPI003B58A55D
MEEITSNDNNKNAVENGVIYVVATPIGNMEDITIRALKILRNVDFILAEDTRVALKLLNFYNIKNKLFSYHSHSSEYRINEYINEILNGNSAAIVSDAGTPCISDPGVSIIKLAIEKNIKIVPVGGISAFTSLLSVSGISGNTLFVGFLSNKSGKRRNQLKELYNNQKTIIVIYESVYRVKECIEDIVNIFGEKTDIVIGREITKQFEQIIRSEAKNILDFFTDGSILTKGEFCIIIDNRKSKVCEANAENNSCKESDYDN